MYLPIPEERPYELAAIVDSVGVGVKSAGDIDGGEAAVAVEEATAPIAAVLPNDLAAIVDPVGGGRTG
jgi:hypothetical protein